MGHFYCKETGREIAPLENLTRKKCKQSKKFTGFVVQDLKELNCYFQKARSQFSVQFCIELKKKDPANWIVLISSRM